MFLNRCVAGYPALYLLCLKVFAVCAHSSDRCDHGCSTRA